MAKQARSLRTYDRALEAAAQEFARYGYANTNLQNVADRIGLTKGALYGHFPNKEKLADALSDLLTSAVKGHLDNALLSSGPAPERLRDLVLGLAGLFQTDLRAHAALRLLIENARAAAEPAPLLDKVRRVVLQLVSETQHQGHWDPSMTAEPIADLIVAVFFGAYVTESPGGPSELCSKVAAMWNIVVRALRAHPGP